MQFRCNLDTTYIQLRCKLDGTKMQLRCNLYCQTPVLGLGLGVDFTFAWDNNNDKKNPHLNFLERNSMRGYGMKDKE